MRAVFLLVLLGLGACGNIEQIAAAPFQDALPRWQTASPNPRPITAQYTQIQPAPVSAETIALQQREELQEQESARAQAAWRQVAQKASIVPMSLYREAPVCTSYDDVRLMLDVIQNYWGDSFAYKSLGDQAALLHGAPPEKPIPEAYGCVLLPIGTRVTVNMKNTVPVITTQFKGKLIIGVTVDGFLKFDDPMPD